MDNLLAMDIQEIRNLRFHAEKLILICSKLENQHEGLKSGQLSAPQKKGKLTEAQKLTLINQRKKRRALSS